jgi:predicted outer membrane repeat protein
MHLTTTPRFVFYRLMGALLGLLQTLSSWAQTSYVTPQGAGQQTGADWANALPGNLLQPRLASAPEGAEFRLAGGTYKPSYTGDRGLSFSIPSGVKVLGGYLGSGANPDQRIDFATTDQPSSTTLSGDVDNDGQTDADNSNNIVVFNQANDQTRLDGVIITGGYATTPLANPALAGTQVGGAGIYNNAYQGNSSPTLENCLLIDNQTTGQGGALLIDLRLGVTSMKVINTDFYTNTALKGGAVYYYGNLSHDYIQPGFANCKFWSNAAESGGAVYIDSFFRKPDNPTVFKVTYVNCSFNNNRASSQGGAIYTTIKSDVSVTIDNELVNCSVSGNSATAGGAFVNVAEPYLSTPDGLGINPQSAVNLHNSILWNNGGANALRNVNYTQSPGNFLTGEGKVSATYSLLESGAVLDFTYKSTVTSVSPFSNEQSQQLDPCSLAINTGFNDQYNVYTPGPPTDLAGKPRIFPVGGTIDLGAYEYQIDLAITQQPASQSVVAMESMVETTVGFTQPAANYAWYKDGVLVNGQTSATLKLTNVMPQQTGSYQLVASTGCTSLTTTTFLLTVTIPEGQTVVLYVTPGGGGEKTGTDWANALAGSQLPAQLASASAGLEFRLAGGTYKPSQMGDRTRSFSIPSGVRVLGGYLGSGANPDQRIDFTNPDQPSSTTLSGDIDNDNLLDAENANIVVLFTNVSPQTRLDGVVITGGYATVPIHFTNAVGGGGIYNNGYLGSSHPTIVHCVLTQNYTTGRGGAVYNDGGLGRANPVFSHCRFINNRAGEGGGVYNRAYQGIANPVFTNCTFRANAALSGGAMYNYAYGDRQARGGETSPRLINCGLSANTASVKGGGMVNQGEGAGSDYVASTTWPPPLQLTERS